MSVLLHKNHREQMHGCIQIAFWKMEKQAMVEQGFNFDPGLLLTPSHLQQLCCLSFSSRARQT